MELAKVPAEDQTRWAGIFLEDQAKTWYRNTYARVRPLQALDVFLESFKEHYLASHSDDDIIFRLEQIEQGERPTGEYSMEFQSLVLQLGTTDIRFVRKHYMRGLRRRIRDMMLSTYKGTESLAALIKHAAIVSANLDLGKSFEPRTHTAPRTESKSSVPITPALTAINTVPTVNRVDRDMDSSGKFVARLTEPEKEYLSRTSGCYNCRYVKLDWAHQGYGRPPGSPGTAWDSRL